MSTTNVSLVPTSASGLLCNSSPLATAIAVATTEADVHALANVVRGQHAPVTGATWSADVYGQQQQPTVAVAALHPLLRDAESIPTCAEETNTAAPLPSPDASAISSPRVSVVVAGSAEADREAAVQAGTVLGAHDVPDNTSAPPFAMTVTTGASRLRAKNVSWQCGLCGYHVLAMDQDGTPLPFATSAFGNVLPLLCPRCKLSHTSWQPSTPFSEQGDHVNMPTTYSNRYVAPATTAAGGGSRGAALQRSSDAAAGAPSITSLAGASRSGVVPPTRMSTVLNQRAAAASINIIAQQQQQRAGKYRGGVHGGGSNNNGVGGTSASLLPRQRRAYYCGHCDRRLLRVDANGELVDMDRDKDGSIRPIRCPGCGEMHSDWVVRPYAVRN